MATMPKTLTQFIVIPIASLMIMLGTAEGIVRILELDLKRMKSYWQLAALVAHTKLPDQNPRIYGFKKNYEGIHEDAQGPYLIKINSLGFRGPERKN